MLCSARCGHGLEVSELLSFFLMRQQRKKHKSRSISCQSVSRTCCRVMMESFHKGKRQAIFATMFLIMCVVMFAIEPCDCIVAAGGAKHSVGDDTANHEIEFSNAEDNNASVKHQSTVDKRTADYGGHDYYAGHYGEVSGGGYGGGGGGGGYGHAVHHDHHHYDAALKGLLIPLAGIALLSVAAVFASNPVLLQLGVTSGKRRRRHAPSLEAVQRKLNDITLLERFIDQVPEKELDVQEKRLLANYLACTGITNSTRSLCLERLSCDMQHPSATVMDIERHVMNIVITEIINNEFIATSTKEGIRRARRTGLHGGDCSIFPCNKADIEKL